MRKYLTVKNALLTLVVASIYYKSVFVEASMFIRIIATIFVVAALMGTLQEVDDLYMEHTGYSENEKSA